MAKSKKCKWCKEAFTQFQPMQKVCSPSCAIKLATSDREKKEAKQSRVKKAEFLLTDKRHQTKLAQQEFNRFIRLRDHHLPCISCGRHHKGQYHAGHYRTVGAHRELRFEELNCHKQCSVCNNHKSGNITDYRINLARKISSEQLEWLEGAHDSKQYTIEELIEIKTKYRNLANDLAAKLGL